VVGTDNYPARALLAQQGVHNRSSNKGRLDQELKKGTTIGPLLRFAALIFLPKNNRMKPPGKRLTGRRLHAKDSFPSEAHFEASRGR
jgi:hypothetical protein